MIPFVFTPRQWFQFKVNTSVIAVGKTLTNVQKLIPFIRKKTQQFVITAQKQVIKKTALINKCFRTFIKQRTKDGNYSAHVRTTKHRFVYEW